MSERLLITSALPYANGPIHLGHMAGAYLPADFYVRYQRLKKKDVLYICGSDEHGVPITLAAEQQGIEPKEIVDKYHNINKEIFNNFGISFDYYGRTSSPTHHEMSQSIFKKLYDKGIFKQKDEQQFFDPKANMFLPDRYVKGVCPICGFEEAYGDQCEKCGSSLSPTDLGDPKSMVTGETPVMKETNHWYLPLGDFQEWLEEWIDEQTDWKPNVRGQCKSWLNQGLSDRAVTRDLTWGVDVPLPDTEGKVLYVWFDAPIGYISATKEWAEQQNDPERWKTYWQDEDTRLIHFIGKDNIVFHCIMFPATLKAHGDYILPENVPANEFLNLEGRKLSTSRGWAVWLGEYLEDFEPDLMRYVLGTTLPETKDSDFSWKDFQTRVNSELADILGNFAFRTLTFLSKYFDNKVPELKNPSDYDKATLKEISKARETIESKYENFRFREALNETMNLARVGNKYLTEMEPWKTRKTDMETCSNTLHVCAQITAALSILFEPVIPFKMSRLREDLGIDIETFGWDDVGEVTLEPGHEVYKGEILFEKLDDEIIDAQLNKLKERSQKARQQEEQKEFAPLKEQVDYEEFAKLDMRAGKIINAETVEKADKLLKLTVDIGIEQRTLAAGIAEHYKPEDLIGQKVVVLANLAPKKLMGIESQGMLLMAEDTEGELYFLPSDAEPGSQVS